MCTYILLCEYLSLPCLLITVNVWIQVKGTSLFYRLQWTLLITVNVSTLLCHSGSSRDRASQSVMTDRPGCWSTWHCYWLQWMYAGWHRPLSCALLPSRLPSGLLITVNVYTWSPIQGSPGCYDWAATSCWLQWTVYWIQWIFVERIDELLRRLLITVNVTSQESCPYWCTKAEDRLLQACQS